MQNKFIFVPLVERIVKIAILLGRFSAYYFRNPPMPRIMMPLSCDMMKGLSFSPERI